MLTRCQICLSALFALTSVAGAAAQDARFDVRFSVGVPDSAIGERGSHYRLFEPSDLFRLYMAVLNNSPNPLVVSHARLAASMSIELRDGDEQVAIETVWGPFAVLSSGATVAREEDVLLDGRVGVTWELHLRRSDGRPWSRGSYLVSIALRPEGAFRTPEGRPVTVPERLTGVTIEVNPPQSSTEVAWMYRTAASTATRSGDLLAEAAYMRAIAADQDDELSRWMLGLTYVGQGRYKEAIARLERALERRPDDRHLIAQALAMAYIGTGDEQRAVAILKARGLPDPRIEETIRALRIRVKEIAAQSR